MRRINRTSIFRPGLVLTLLIGLLAAGQPARAAALVTIVEGGATLIDGARAVIAAEGLKVGDETIVRTSDKTSLLRIEWPDGSAADFGPDTQAMLNPRGLAGRGASAPAVYLMRGWLKLSSLGSDSVAGLVAPRVEVQPFKGALVVRVAEDETWVFAESGSAGLVEREVKPPSSVSLRSGAVYLRTGGASGTVLARPTSAQMARVPPGFRDTLPLRSAKLKDRIVTPKPAPDPAYEDLRDWLIAEAGVRRNLLRRFADRKRDVAFRAGLVADLHRHPEWERVLFPERFIKPASAPR
jgi:hypothetical protein